ncbi:XRE family transcriptional regulator [Aliiroseovarius crassostreae]|uniref:XRE family transcriptional regulator n=1 Tax=Aliiroseovarius crassostreae TaxID=154981 RepID=UPI003C7B687A
MNKLDYRLEIAAALRREFGGSHQAIKASMNWTGVSERTAKNWLAGAHGPAGEHLIELMRHSDEVAETVLALCGRSEVAISLDLTCLRTALVRMLTTADEIIGTET